MTTKPSLLLLRSCPTVESPNPQQAITGTPVGDRAIFESPARKARPKPATLACWMFTAIALSCLSGLPLAGQDAVVQLQASVIAAIAKAEPSVVAIACIPKNEAATRLGLPDIQGQFFDPNRLPLDRLDPTSSDYLPGKFASGVVIDQAGHIVTTYHALGDPRKHDYVIWHQGNAGRAVRVATPPQVLAGDPWTDLAVLKSKPVGKPIEFAKPGRLRRGTFVIALGNPYALARDGRPSAAWGIVANLRRPAPPLTGATSAIPKPTLHHYGTLIQVDLRLPLGTSGGALVDLEGKLVGLTTSLAPLLGYESPAGYALPADETFRRTIDKLKTGRVPAFGFLGVQPEDLTPQEKQLVGGGARVVRVVSGTAAATAGLAVGDIITHVNGRPVDNRDDLIRLVSSLAAHTKASLAIHRLPSGGRTRKHLTIAVELNKKPIETWLTAFESAEPPTWRGARIDEATAVPLSLRRQSGTVPDPKGCVGILEVDRDSPAWKAGLRGGMFVSHVNGQRVSNPQAFFAATAQADTAQSDIDVSLTVLDAGAGRRQLIVSR